jgi:hypothetical protein
MIKSKHLFFVSFLLLAYACSAQQGGGTSEYDNRKFSFGFNLGNGYPLNGYGGASTSQLPMSRLTNQDTNRISGYAKPGIHYDIYASYEILNHVSIMLAVDGDKDYYDVNTLNLQYAAYFPPNTVSAFTGYEYFVSQYLAGPKLNLPISEYCSIECRVLAGFTTVDNPNLNFYNAKDTIGYSFPTGKGFGYNIGAGIKYIAAEGYIGLHLMICYGGAVIKYPNYTVYYSSGANIYNNTYNAPKKMILGILQVAVGISLEL